MKHIILSLLAFTISITGFSQTVISIVADRDNTLYSESDAISNGSGIQLFAGQVNSGGGNALRRALLHFDLATIPRCATIQNVSLELEMDKSNIGASNLFLHSLTKDWGEAGSDASGEEGQGAVAQTNDASWEYNFYNSSSWDTEGGDFESVSSASSVVGSANGSYTWSSVGMASDVQDWIGGIKDNFGWVLIGDESTPSAKRFKSRENGTTNQRPKLKVTYQIPTLSNMETIDDNPIAEGAYWADETINSSGRVASNSIVIFNAGQGILLNPNFEVETPSEFTTIIADCPENP